MLKHYLLPLAILAACALPMTAAAEDHSDHPHGDHGHHPHHQPGEHPEADGDNCKKCRDDADGDREGRKERREERLMRFDANGDGELDEAERAAAKEARQEHGKDKCEGKKGEGKKGKGKKCKGKDCDDKDRGEWKKRFDTNGDGELDEAERAAAKEAHAAHKQERMSKAFEHLDADGDGQISREEFQNMQKMRGKHKDKKDCGDGDCSKRKCKDKKGHGEKGPKGKKGDKEHKDHDDD